MTIEEMVNTSIVSVDELRSSLKFIGRFDPGTIYNIGDVAILEDGATGVFNGTEFDVISEVTNATIKSSPKMYTETRCKYCGAPLIRRNNKVICEYCDTQYE